MNTSEKESQYTAIYGAYVAAEVREYMRLHGELPDYENMRSIVEDAYSVAEFAEEVQDWEPKDEEDVGQDAAEV